jgi:hypothetical protein
MNAGLEDKDYEALIEHELEQLKVKDKRDIEDKKQEIPEDYEFLRLLDKNREQIKKTCYIVGIVSSLLLLLFYFALVSLLESFDHAFESFANIWLLMSLLVAGFGFQMSLFTYIRQTTKLKKISGLSSKNTAATGGVSTVSMVACCAHHIAEVIPILGISALAIFLTDFQIWFIVLAVFSNFLGTLFMFKIIKEHNLYNPREKIFSWFENWDMKEALKTMTAVSIIILVFFALILIMDGNNKTTAEGLDTLVDNQNAITVEATPLGFNPDEELMIDIKMDTHSVDLNYKMAAISILEDSKGNTYNALKWDGSPPGGHHRSGTLSFPPVEGSTNYLKLTIPDINGADRVFTWNLN